MNGWPYNTSWFPRTTTHAIVFVVVFQFCWFAAYHAITYNTTSLYVFFALIGIYCIYMGPILYYHLPQWLHREPPPPPPPEPSIGPTPGPDDADTPPPPFPAFEELEKHYWQFAGETGMVLPAPQRATLLEMLTTLYHERTFHYHTQSAFDDICRVMNAYIRNFPPAVPAALSTYYYERQADLRGVIFDVMTPLKGTPTYHKYHANAVRLSVDLEKGGQFMWPQNFKGSNAEVFNAYLHDSPLRPLFEAPVPYPLHWEKRVEHQWVIANTGHGKTETLKLMIAHDIQQAIEGKCSVIVMDAKNRMIPLLSKLKVFAPGEPLHEKLIYLEPAKAPPAINLLRLKDDNANELLSLYKMVFGQLFDSGMTDNQQTLFENCMMLLREREGTTLRDLYNLMTPGHLQGYATELRKLDDITREFFRQDFGSEGTDGYSGTKQQVKRRLYTLFRANPFKDMFTTPDHALDLFDQLKEPKIILVNTAGLGNGTRLFGRFFLALIANAMRRRTRDPLPCWVYIDECDQYIKDDPSTIELIARGREAKVGMIFAHRWIDEVGERAAKALESNTTIIFAGGLKGSDVPVVARAMELKRDQHHLLSRTKGDDHTIFTAYIRGLPINTIRVPFGQVDRELTMSDGEHEALLQEQFKRWGADPKPPPPEDEPDDYGASHKS